jgi:hypothetical protein
MPTEAAAREFADRWIAAWNAHDLDGILEHYAEDVEFVSPFAANFTADASGVIRGKAALRAYFVRALGAYPDLQFELDYVGAGVSSVAIAYRSVNDQRAIEVMELESARVVRVLAHYAAS